MEDQLRLTKHFDLLKEFKPLYTGGAFHLMKDEQTALTLRDSKICVFNLLDSQVIADNISYVSPSNNSLRKAKRS